MMRTLTILTVFLLCVAAAITTQQGSLMANGVRTVTAGSSASFATNRSAATPPPARRTPRTIALGADIEGFPTDRGALDRYAARVGRMPAIVMWFQAWGEYFNSFDSGLMTYIRARGAVPMITWEPWNGVNPDPTYQLKNIVQGQFDPYIRTWATAARRWRHPFFVRLGHEMNGGWYPWGTGAGNGNHNTPADYIAAWRHVHDIFRQVGAKNVIWVWAPNTIYAGSTPYALDYPGDRYVDWLGLSVYNSGPPYAAWISLRDVLSPSYAALIHVAQKPVMIAEMGSSEVGGDKAAWITQGLLSDLPAHFRQIHAVVWFDRDKRTDWRINSSPATLAAWRQIVASPLYRGRFHGKR